MKRKPAAKGFGLSAAALESDWVGLARPAEASRRGRKRSPRGEEDPPVRDPAKAGRRFVPLLLADAHRREEPVAICDLESS